MSNTRKTCGGSKCSTKKQQRECEASSECVWGKTGKCSQKRKPGNKKASAANAVSLIPSVAQTKSQGSPAQGSPAQGSPRSQGSPAQGSPKSQGSPRSQEEEEELVQKTKEDFQPGATLKNVRANDDVDLKGHNMKGIKIVGGNMVSVDLRGDTGKHHV
jgi:hypothetical protein